MKTIIVCILTSMALVAVCDIAKAEFKFYSYNPFTDHWDDGSKETRVLYPAVIKPLSPCSSRPVYNYNPTINVYNVIVNKDDGSVDVESCVESIECGK